MGSFHWGPSGSNSLQYFLGSLEVIQHTANNWHDYFPSSLARSRSLLFLLLFNYLKQILICEYVIGLCDQNAVAYIVPRKSRFHPFISVFVLFLIYYICSLGGSQFHLNFHTTCDSYVSNLSFT